jgi:hypothetical protein
MQDNERGWKMAGLFMLIDGLALKQQNDAPKVADNMSDAKLTDLKAKIELKGVDFTLAQFATECEPFRVMQKAIVAVMRGATN